MRKIAVKVSCVLLCYSPLPSKFLKADDSFCSVMQRVIDAANNDFQNLRGRRDHDSFWYSTLTLPSATDCKILADKDSSSFHCTWDTDSPKEGFSHYEQFAEGLKGCFPESSVKKLTPEGEDPLANTEQDQVIPRSTGTIEAVLMWDRSSVAINLMVVKHQER